jgi:cell division septation protein DedD
MLNYDNTKNVHLLKQYYPSNTSNFGFQFISGGITIKLLKPTKQLIATITKDQWDGDPSIKVRGTIVYKRKSKIFEKQVDVEMINSKDSLVSKIPANQEGVFTTKNIFPDDFKFILEKPNSKIIKADLEIIHNNRLSIFDDYPALTIVEDGETDNLISRDNNFSVVLREGFQHEVGITALSNNVSGKLSTSTFKQACKNILVFLKNKRDSIVAVTKPNEDCTFGFQDIPSGPYTLIFVSTNADTVSTFNYNFNEPSPIIQRQFNGEKDSLLVDYIGNIKEWKEDTMDVDKLLLYQESRLLVKKKELIVEKDSNNTIQSKNSHRVIIHPNGDYEVKASSDSSALNNSGSAKQIEDLDLNTNEPIHTQKEEVKSSNLNKVGKNSQANSNGKLSEGNQQNQGFARNQTASVKDLPPGKTYDLNGRAVEVKGYAVQVGAFASFQNAKKLAVKVNSLTHGSSYIQVLNHGENKLYRVIVGEYRDLQTASSWQSKLKKAGYDTYIRKHLPSTATKK